jgi:hypothetical protein
MYIAMPSFLIGADSYSTVLPVFENVSYAESMRALYKSDFNKLKLAYDSCMDWTALKRAGVAPLRSLLDELDLLFPQTTSQAPGTNRNEELTKTLIWMFKSGVPSIITPTVKVCCSSSISPCFLTV